MVEQTRPAVPLDHPDEKLHRQILARHANASMAHDGTRPMSAPLKLWSTTVAVLVTSPYAAGLWPGAMVFASDEAGGPVPAFSDGTNWLRVTDRAVVS